MAEPEAPMGVSLKRYAAITAVVLATIGVAQLVVQAIGVLMLIFISFLLAVGLEPAVSWLVRRSIRRIWAITMVCSCGAILTAGLTAVVLVPAVREFGELVEKAPDGISRIASQLGDTNTTLGRYLGEPQLQEGLQKALEQLPSLLGSSVGAVLGVLTQVVGGIFAMLTVAALTIYFMAALPGIVERVAILLGTRERDRLWRAALDKVGGYLMGQLIISTLAGLSAFGFLLIAGVPFPAVLAVAVWLLSFVPQVGAFAGALLSVAVALSTSLPTAIFTVGFFIVYQLVENYIIAPRVFSHTTALSPLAAFTAALVGAAAAGFVGAVISLPLAAAGRVVVKAMLDKRESQGRIATKRAPNSVTEEALEEPDDEGETSGGTRP